MSKIRDKRAVSVHAVLPNRAGSDCARRGTVPSPPLLSELAPPLSRPRDIAPPEGSDGAVHVRVHRALTHRPARHRVTADEWGTRT